VTQNSVGVGGSYTDATKKERFQNAVPVFILLRKNFQNTVLACSSTKIYLLLLFEFINPVFLNPVPRTGLNISFWSDLYLVFPLVGI
jgi:hypothetical protein